MTAQTPSRMPALGEGVSAVITDEFRGRLMPGLAASFGTGVVTLDQLAIMPVGNNAVSEVADGERYDAAMALVDVLVAADPNEYPGPKQQWSSALLGLMRDARTYMEKRVQSVFLAEKPKVCVGAERP